MAGGIGERVLYEDNHYIVVNKHAGELVQGDSTGDVPLVQLVSDYLASKRAEEGRGGGFVQVAHRVDRPVSGAVLFAKSSKGLVRINELFREHAVRRLYWAVTERALPNEEGSLEGFLSRDSRLNKSFVSPEKREGSQEVSLRYRLLGLSTRYYLYEVELHTGRHHQIRAQLAAAGAVIRGDLKYGARRSRPGGGIDLHARLLSFAHPIQEGRRVHVEAPAPVGGLWGKFA